MSLKFNLLCASAVVLLTACGGGSSSSSDPNDMMAADTTAPSLSVSSSNLSVQAGETLSFDVIAMDSGGFGTTDLSCAEGSLVTTSSDGVGTQTVSADFGAPATSGTVTCTANSTDGAGNSASLNFTIDVTPAPVNTAAFNGEWVGPCYNNGFGFSVRQSLTINGTSLTSFIESFTAGAIPAQNCVLPAEGLLITTDVSASLNFQSDVNVAGCMSGRAVETDVNILTVDTSGNPTATSQPDIDDTLNLVTGFTNVLPSPTDICILENGNLLFAGVEYTGESDNSAVVFPMIDLESPSTWSLGDNDYVLGTSNSSESADGLTEVTVVSTVSDTSNGDFSGSALTLSYTLNGPGVYQVTSTEEFSLVDASDPSVQLVDLNATVGTGVGTNATRYDSVANAGFIVVSVDEDGAYHFSTEQSITLERTIDVDGGVPNAPPLFFLQMNNVFDSQE